MNIKKIVKKFFKRARRVPDRFFWSICINKYLNKNIVKKQQKDLWEKEYSTFFLHHSHQNKLISKDFLRKIKSKPIFSNLLSKSRSVLDIGCGTGELSHFIYKKYKTDKILGLEISETAINIASILYNNKNVSFVKIAADEDLLKFGKFDVVVCSQVLEHFLNPYTLIDKMFKLSDNVIILVPYNQPVKDAYEEEGGAGHVFRFTENNFKQYNILDSFVFETLGWDYSSYGEEPRQLAILINKKYK
jgi:2-polyprenyl-3-methyl-5-hydroxy-6-metoxy-1,4-benzoquinol methylase